ncbi:MAG: beta-lactamase family protein [Bacilli bacterium]|nr:beta-lactamase family protein [Bacilli bacterium]
MKYTISKEDFFNICQEYDIVGGNIVVVDHNEMVTYQYGLMDKEDNVATKDTTIYRIASISKTVLAIGAMKLVEMGLLNLDEDISTYLGFKVRNPKFPDKIITTRMLMTQTSSITDGFEDEDITNVDRFDGYNGVNGRSLNLPLETLLVPNDSIYYTDLTFSDYEPGTNFIYSNFGCGILACIMEKVANQNYDDFMKEHIFDKLGLDASYYAYNIKHQDMIASLYSGERVNRGVNFPKRAYKKAPIGQSYLGPAGGLFIKPLDLAKIMQSFWKKEYQVLKDETIKKMMEINWVGSADEYKKKALQLMVIEDIVPITLYGHFGSAYGLRSMMFFNKELETGVCFMTNGITSPKRKDLIPAIHYDIITKIWGK